VRKGGEKLVKAALEFFFLGVIERERGREEDKEALMGAVEFNWQWRHCIKEF
jgi:hypothetical protein